MTVAFLNPPARAATIQDVTSPSGIKAWLVEDKSTPVVALSFSFAAGTASSGTRRFYWIRTRWQRGTATSVSARAR